MKNHYYQIQTAWKGNKGLGTANYQAYERDHVIAAPEKMHEILASSDPAFRGDPTKYNPEELLLSAVSGCHLLWYLHLCAVNKIVVTNYLDNAKGIMVETENGSGKFSEITLFPVVTVTEQSMVEKAKELHQQANKMCFIANSCNFPIKHEVSVFVKK